SGGGQRTLFAGPGTGGFPVVVRGTQDSGADAGAIDRRKAPEELNDERFYQMSEAYIISAYRSPVGKAPRGQLRTVRPDDLAAAVVRHLVGQLPGLDPER